jgi:hypothetical protein
MLTALLVSAWRGNKDLYPDNSWGLSKEQRYQITEALYPLPHIDVLLHGAASGGDKYISMSKSDVGAVVGVPANWKLHGDIAGPLRNTHMLTIFGSLVACGYKPFCYCFPGPSSVGTWDMYEKVKGSGLCTPVVVELKEE